MEFRPSMRPAKTKKGTAMILILALLFAMAAVALGARPNTFPATGISYATSCSNSLAFMKALDVNGNAICHTLVNGLNALTGNISLISNTLGIKTVGQNIQLEVPPVAPTTYTINFTVTAGITTYSAINSNGRTVYGGSSHAGAVSGGNAPKVIQSAINSIPNGGRIAFQQGPYYINTTITDGPSISLIAGALIVGSQINGCGTCGTQFLGAQSAGTPMLIVSTSSDLIQGIQFNGQKTSNSVVAGQDCLQINAGGSLAAIQYDSFVNCPDAGIYHNANAGEDTLTNLDVKTNNLAGYYCNSCFDSHVIGGDYGSNVGEGIKGVTCADVGLVDVHEFLSSTSNGITFSNCYNVRVTGSSIHNNWKNGIEFFKSINSAIDGNFQTISGSQVFDNSQQGVGSWVGIQIAGSAGDIASFNIVSGNVMWDDQGTKTQAYGIEESPFAGQNDITDNVVPAEASGSIFTTSSNSQIADNLGYAPAITTFTAMTSVYTFTNTNNYDVLWYLFTANGISAWSCDGIPGLSLTPGVSSCDIPNGGTMTITWTVTAPVFKGIPLNN